MRVLGRSFLILVMKHLSLMTEHIKTREETHIKKLRYVNGVREYKLTRIWSQKSLKESFK